MAGVFAPSVRGEYLSLCRELLGVPTEKQLAEASDESLEEFSNPFDGDEELEASFVPCRECDSRTRVRQSLDGPLVRALLQVAAAVWLLLQTGSELTIRAAIALVASAQSEQRPVHRALQPNRMETHEDLIGFIEAVINDRVREQRQREQQQRGPPLTQAGSEDARK